MILLSCLCYSFSKKEEKNVFKSYCDALNVSWFSPIELLSSEYLCVKQNNSKIIKQGQKWINNHFHLIQKKKIFLWCINAGCHSE